MKELTTTDKIHENIESIDKIIHNLTIIFIILFAYLSIIRGKFGSQSPIYNVMYPNKWAQSYNLYQSSVNQMEAYIDQYSQDPQ